MKINLQVNTDDSVVFDDTQSLATISGGIAQDLQSQRLQSLMLITRLAEDKIGYPIREILTNAYDASPATPPVIHFPSISEPWFSVRDFGPGLGPSNMHRATTLLSSGSRGSSKKTGGFGIGMKSWAAYLLSVEQPAEATLTSITAGVSRVYLLRLNRETIEITADLLSEDPTEEPSGLEISWAIRPRDVTEWNRKLNEIGRRFPAPYNAVFNESEQTLVAPNVWLIPGTGCVFVRSGAVAYPWPRSLAWPLTLPNKSDLIFDTPLGTVTPALNREVLEQDPQTVETCKALLAQLRTHTTQVATKARSQGLDALRALPKPFQLWADSNSGQPLDTETRYSALAPFADPPRRYGFAATDAKKKLTRVNERMNEAEASSQLSGPAADLPKLRAFGYNVVDLSTLVLPAREPRKANKSVVRFVSIYGTLSYMPISDLKGDALVIPCETEGRRRRWKTCTGYPNISEVNHIAKSLIKDVYFVPTDDLKLPVWEGRQQLRCWVQANLDPPPVLLDIERVPYQLSDFLRKTAAVDLPSLVWIRQFCTDYQQALTDRNAAEDKLYYQLFDRTKSDRVTFDGEAERKGWPRSFPPLSSLISRLDNYGYYSGSRNLDKLGLYLLKGLDHDYNALSSRTSVDPDQRSFDLVAEQRLPLSAAA
jgi:hypothetical protein